MLYATDGRCHNAEPGSYGHECGKPAAWVGIKPGGFRSGYCEACKASGSEARGVTAWHRITGRGVIGWVAPELHCAGLAVFDHAGPRIYSFGRGVESLGDVPAYLARFIPGWSMGDDGAVIGSVAA